MIHVMNNPDFIFSVGRGWAGQRLDRFLAARESDVGLSRSAVKRLVLQGDVLVNGRESKAGCTLRAGDQISVTLPPSEPVNIRPEPVEFEIIFEDAQILVLNKPAGVVVHPAPGHCHGTLVNGLLYHCHDLSGIGGEERPGIVHRLDRDTSGVMVVARTNIAHRSLAAQFSGREVEKEYIAILEAAPSGFAGTVDLPIGRHPVKRKKMAVVSHGGRRAVTHWTLVRKLAYGFALVHLGLETGRTHQIRVHMASINAPVAGDSVYGGRRKKQWPGLGINRQMLHAVKLAFTHPLSGERMQFTAPLRPDMKRVLALLEGEDGG